MLTVLLSPSKKLDESKIDLKQCSDLHFKNEAIELAGILKNKSVEDIQSLMSLSDNLAKLNYDRFQSFDSSFNISNGAKQALYLFKGDVYDKMDVNNYKEGDLEFAQSHIRILSGLYGYIKPLDLIQPYRLEMGRSLKNNNGKDLYSFWKNKIVNQINIENESGYIINLASNEYFKAVDKKLLKATLININLKQNKNGQVKTIGLMAKRARGLMADFIIKNKITNIEDLKNFKEDGYKFISDLSDTTNYTFILDM